MDIQKPKCLHATSDVQPIISGAFLLNDRLTELYIYPNELKMIQQNKICSIPIELDLTFSFILGNEGPIGIQFWKEKEKIELLSDFWPKIQEWEKALLSCMTHKNFHEYFRPTKKIGKGNFASVYLAEELSKNRKVAVKAFMKETAFKDNGKRSIQNEIKVMRTVHSQNTVKLHGVYSTPNSLYLSMEYIQGSTLQLYLKRHRQLDRHDRRKILKALLTGLRDLKKVRIVHRDIKPQNIIISQSLDSIKIIDFGLATNIDQPSYIFIRCGTPGFIAPEILRIKDLQSVRLGVESDMFSVGAIYYRMLFGKYLFEGKDQSQVLRNNRECRMRIPQGHCAGYEQMQLLRKMLDISPLHRITPEDALNNPFFRENRENNRMPFQSLENVELSTSWSQIQQ